jgi:large subunit ribosomal protein L27
LGMVASTMESSFHTSALASTESANILADKTMDGSETALVHVEEEKKGSSGILKARKVEGGRNLTLRPGYMYREANWEIGRAAERAKIEVREFKPRDRWAAWRKSTVRKGKNAEKRGLSKRGSKKK